MPTDLSLLAFLPTRLEIAFSIGESFETHSFCHASICVGSVAGSCRDAFAMIFVAALLSVVDTAFAGISISSRKHCLDFLFQQTVIVELTYYLVQLFLLHLQLMHS